MSNLLDGFRTPDVRPVIYRGLESFKVGQLDRYLRHILQHVGAISCDPESTPGLEFTRASDDRVATELQACLDAITKVVMKEENTSSMKIIQDALAA